jgi:hypothetical protein
VIVLVPRVNVVITNFSDFCRFSAKKWLFFYKANVTIHFLYNLEALLAKKRQLFGRKYFYYLNISPRQQANLNKEVCFGRAKRFYSKTGYTTKYDWPIRGLLDEAEDYIANDAQEPIL